MKKERPIGPKRVMLKAGVPLVGVEEGWEQ